MTSLTFGEMIKIYRTRKGFTQKELGRMLGISSVTVLNYEKGRIVPDIEVLKNIIIILELPKDITIKK